MTADKQITVTVQSGRGSQEFTFEKTTKVQEVIAAAAAALGYPPQGNYSLVRVTSGDVLDGQRPLVSFHIEDGEVLVLSETGSGV
jgi:hypothetical protein